MKKAKELLAQETESLKKKSLGLRKNFDQFKSKNVLKTLALKKKLKDSVDILSDSRIVWKSEMLNLKNAAEIFNVTQSKKELIREKLFDELIRNVSGINLAHLGMPEKENLYNLKITESILDSSCNCSESTLNQTMTRTIDSIKEKVKNLQGNSSTNNLTAVDEKIEISIDSNLKFATSSSNSSLKSENFRSEIEDDSSLNSIPSDLISLKSYESSSNQIKISKSPEPATHRSYKSIKSSKSISKNQSEKEEIDDTMIGLIENTGMQMTNVGVTMPDNIGTLEKGAVYVISESDNGEKTQEVQVSKRSWRVWLCPCIFKVKY